MNNSKNKYSVVTASLPPRRIVGATLPTTRRFSLLSLTIFSMFLLFATPTTVLADLQIGASVSTEDVGLTASNSFTGCGGAQVPSSNLDYEARVVELVNQIRMDNGLLPLKRVAQLDDASRFHASDMGVDDYFSHNSHDRVNGQLVESCKWSDRIGAYYTNWSSISENIAAGYTSPEDVVKGWMESPGHKKNILADTNWEIGVGYYSGQGSYTHYWVQNFGQRRDHFPVVINGEAAKTDTGDLAIHIYGQWENIRLRTNEGAWSEWRTFEPRTSWFLEGDPGEHTVHIEMRNGSTVAHSSDTIYLTRRTLPATLSNLPDRLSFLYDTGKNQLTPPVHVLQPIPNADGYTWQASVDSNWLEVTPAQGNHAQTVTIRPKKATSGSTGSSARVLLSLYDSAGTAIESHSIEVSISSSDLSNQVYLPTLMSGR
jgi:uncharacterized protein YkwD